MITVFTPTYNRKKLLPRLYESLCNQTNKDFEWLVIDDGSSDDTFELFSKWQSQNSGFNVVYHKQENGGKHRAINKGVSLANGEIFFIVDSDDFLRADAIDVVYKYWEQIKEITDLCGICGLRVYPDGTLVGSTVAGDYVDAFKYDLGSLGISGDKSEIFKTSVLKQFPFPEFEGEKFCPEALVWNRISEAGYKLRYFNEGIYFCDYQLDGLTSKIDQLLINNIQSYVLYSSEILKSEHFSLKHKIHCALNLARRCKMRSYSYKQIARIINSNVIVAFLLNEIAKNFYRLRNKIMH